MPDTHPALALLEELLNVPSPSGREERLAAIVREKIDAAGYAHETDGAGNITVRLAGKDTDLPAVVIAAHMDEIGMVVTNIDDDGSLRVDRSGGLFPWKLGECPVEVVGDGETVAGVFSFGSTHRPDVPKEPTWNDARIITGLTKETVREKGIRPGSTAVPARFVRGPVVFGDPRDPLVASWTFDDRGGVLTLLRLLEAIKKRNITPARTTVVAFTVHEEGGCHGAKVLAHRIRPEVFVAVDGCPMPPGAPLTLDGRPGVWSKDRLTHADQELVKAFMQAAREAGTELQSVVYDGASSDASQVYATGGAPRAVTTGIVRENSHGYEVTRLSVFDNLLKTLVAFVKTWN